MPKSITSAMAQHLAGEVTTLASCWRIVRADGQTFGLTDHDRDLTFAGQLYRARSGLSRSAIKSSADLAVDNLDVEALFDADFITEADLRAGLFDYARIECFLVNFTDPDGDGRLWLRKGRLGEVSFRDGTFVCELRGLAQNLAASVVDVVSPVCRYELGDARCGINLAALAEPGTVAAVTSNRVMTVTGSFTATPDWFQNGELVWQSGANAGLTHEVERYEEATGELTLFLAAPFNVEPGDTFELRPGCDKTFATCIAKFQNAINFGGEPHVPGQTNVARFPDAKAGVA